MLNLKAKIYLFVSLLLLLNVANAGSVSSLYNVDIPVKNEDGDTRWRAFVDGMDEVFVRISSDSIVMDKLKRPPASRYVKQFSYEPIEQPIANADGELLSYRLKLQYNGSAMEKYLSENGFPVWGQHRPDVVIWLAVRDGVNEYVLKSSDKSLLKQVADKAMTRRGILEHWPIYDLQDRKVLSVAEIRGGFKEPVIDASKRYSRGPALTGSLIWSGSEWQSSWSLLMTGGDRHWSLVDTNYSRLINKAIDQAADALGVVFAVHNTKDKQQLATVQLDIEAVNSIEKYRYVEDYLTDLNAVERARPVKINGKNVIFELMLNSSEKDFLDLINNDTALIKVLGLAAEQGQTAPKIPDLENSAKGAEGTTNPDISVKAVAVYYYRLPH